MLSKCYYFVKLSYFDILNTVLHNIKFLYFVRHGIVRIYAIIVSIRLNKTIINIIIEGITTYGERKLVHNSFINVKQKNVDNGVE